MNLHTHDIHNLLHNLPHAVQDLFFHEDKTIVEKGLSTLPIITPKETSRITIEKSIDPISGRSAQNIGLFLHDYLQQLPHFEESSADGEKLLAHWRKLLLEQPIRLAEGKKTNWHNEKSRDFWQSKINSNHTNLGIRKENFSATWDDWMCASGATNVSEEQLGKMNEKQWQDFVIRTRLHAESTRNYRNANGVRLGF